MDPMIALHRKVLDELRHAGMTILAPLSDEHINRRAPGLQNTVGILLRHMAGSERYWIGEVVGGVPAGRNRDAEFGGDRLEKTALLAELDRAAAVTREVLARLGAADLLTEVDVQGAGGTSRETKAFALLHTVRHLAYHLGQLRYLAKLAQD